MSNTNRSKINRRVRMWNRYKGMIITAALVVVVGIGVLVALALTGGSGDNEEGSSVAQESTTGKIVNVEELTSSAGQEGASKEQQESASQQESTQAPTQKPTEVPTQAPTQVADSCVLNVVTQVNKEAFSNAAFYSDAVFVGDAIASGVKVYNHLPASKYIGEDNFSTAKASSYVDKVVAAAPKKVFIMMGINDLNYNNRPAAQIANSYAQFVAQLKSKLPNAQIYVISVLPVGKTTAASNVNNNRVKELNDNLILVAKNQGVKFISLTKAFSDAEGNLPAEVSKNGLNIGAAYYPYLLNAIAQVAK